MNCPICGIRLVKLFTRARKSGEWRKIAEIIHGEILWTCDRIHRLELVRGSEIYCHGNNCRIPCFLFDGDFTTPLEVYIMESVL